MNSSNLTSRSYARINSTSSLLISSKLVIHALFASIIKSTHHCCELLFIISHLSQPEEEWASCQLLEKLFIHLKRNMRRSFGFSPHCSTHPTSNHDLLFIKCLARICNEIKQDKISHRHERSSEENLKKNHLISRLWLLHHHHYLALLLLYARSSSRDSLFSIFLGFLWG